MKWTDLLEKLENIELSTNAIIIAVTALCVVTLLMAREFITWMVKTKRVRQDIHSLHVQLSRIEEKIDQLTMHRPATDKLTAEPHFNLNFDIKPDLGSSPTSNL
jgi:hypothetical protein